MERSMKISNPLKYFIILMVIFLPYFFGINLVQDNKASVISLILFVGIVCFASLNNNFSKKNFDLGFNYFYINFLNIVLLFVFIIITQNYYLNYETITWDVASYLVASQEINQGYLPFETQWESKGPLFMYLFNAVSIIAGKNYLYFRLYNDVLIFLITCLMYFKILIHTDSNKLKALVGSLFFSSLVSNVWYVSEYSEIYCLLFISLVSFLFSKYHFGKYITPVYGALLSMATLINQGTILFTFPLLFLLILKTKRSELVKKLINFSIGFIFPHIFFILLYASRDLTNIYLANYISIPLSYISSNDSSLYELMVWLRGFFDYNYFLYSSIIVVIFFSIIDYFLKILINKNLKELISDFDNLNLIFAIAFYFIAGHNYYHHLFYFLFFLPFLIIKITKSSHISLINSFIIFASTSILINTFEISSNNLIQRNQIYQNYPLYQLSVEIDRNFTNNYDVLALDYVLVLYYLQKPNNSYIVHPSNHFEDYIVNELIDLKKIQTNELSYISKLIEDEPTVLLCNPILIIKGVPSKTDPYNCHIADYKKQYLQLDTSKIKSNKNLDYYRDPYEKINVYINEEKK